VLEPHASLADLRLNAKGEPDADLKDLRADVARIREIARLAAEYVAEKGTKLGIITRFHAARNIGEIFVSAEERYFFNSSAVLAGLPTVGAEVTFVPSPREQHGPGMLPVATRIQVISSSKEKK